MSVQTEIKQEKDLFSELSKKVKESETVRISRAPNAPQRKKLIRKIFRFDTLDIKMSFKEEDLDKYFKNEASDLTNEMVFVTDISEVVDLTVMDKSGQKLLTMNCEFYDDKDPNPELQIIRFTLAKKLYETIINKAKDIFKQEALEKEKRQRLKKEQQRLKEAEAKIKASKNLREQQLTTASVTAEALKKINSL